MSNKYRGEVTIELSGKEYILRPSFQAICAIEGELDKSILDILISISEKRPKILEIASIIKYGVRAYQGNSSVLDDDIGKAIFETGVVNIMPQIIQFLELAVGIKNMEG